MSLNTITQFFNISVRSINGIFKIKNGSYVMLVCLHTEHSSLDLYIPAKLSEFTLLFRSHYNCHDWDAS